MIAISSDAVREGARYALTGESYININKLSFAGDVIFHRAGEDQSISHTKHFFEDINQDELTWKVILGLINFYDRHDTPLIIEGMVITPEHVKGLNLKNLKIRAAFVGFLDQEYLNTILEYSRAKKDWIYTKIMEENKGDDSSIREWFKNELVKNKIIARKVKEYGYEFFSPGKESFEEYRDKVASYLLS